MLENADSPLDDEERAAVERAVAFVECAASSAHAPTGDDVSTAMEAVETAVRKTGGGDTANVLVRAANAAALSAQCAVNLIKNANPSCAAAAASFACAAACGCAAVGRPAALPPDMLPAVRRDLEQLRLHCAEEKGAGADFVASRVFKDF